MISRSEWRWVAAVSFLTLAMSSVPLLVGYVSQTSQRLFLGAAYDVQDYHSHLAKMQLGARGEFRYRSLFTPEPHAAEPIILNDITVGFVASRVGVPIPLAYEFSRLLGGLTLLLAAYAFIGVIIPERRTRRLAFILAIVSSGLGWMVLTQPSFSYPNQSPIDFWLADAYLFFSILAFPHFGWSIAALLFGLIAWERYCERPNSGRLAVMALGSLLLGFMQVFELVLLDAVIAIDFARRMFALLPGERLPAFKRAARVALVLMPLHALMAWPYLRALRSNPLVQVWSAQSRTLSPPPLYYIVGYGLLWPLVVLGLIWTFRQRESRLIFPVVWIGTVAMLVYTPNSIQYRWLEGVQVPLAILAATGLDRVLLPALVTRLPNWGSRSLRRWWITVLLVLATTPSTLYLISGNSLLLVTGWPESFLRREEVAAIGWLSENSAPDDTVLAGLRIGNAIPGRIGHRVVLGHWAETMYFEEKSKQVAAFFGDMSDEDRWDLLRRFGVRYVFHGPDERALGDFDPSDAEYLSLRFRDGPTAVFEVVTP